MDKKDFKLIRTERILASLEEATIQQFDNNIRKGFPKTRKRQHATGPLRIAEMGYTPYLQDGKLLVAGLVWSDSGRKYKPEILFDGVVFEEEDTQTNATFTGTDGETYNVQPLKFQNNNARVSCTCLDFYYRFWYYNSKNDDLHPGANTSLWQPYRRKTTTYPPANPKQVSGFCKHLIKLTEEMGRIRLLTR